MQVGILKTGSVFRGEIATSGNFICVVYPKTIFIIKKQKGLLPCVEQRVIIYYEKHSAFEFDQ